MDAIKFRFQISLTTSEGLDMHLIDVVTAIYIVIPISIFMRKSPKDLKCHKQTNVNLVIYTLWSYNNPCTNYNNSAYVV